MRLHSLFAVGVATLGAAAQNQNFVLPTQGLVTNNNIPFAAGIARYQQWYSQSDVVAGLAGVSLNGPLRFLEVDFLPGTGTLTATTLDLEVRIAHASLTGLSGTFDGDLLAPVVVAVPRRTVNLTTGGLLLPFLNQFTWDGQRALVIDVKVFGNGQANQAFAYQFQAATGTAPSIIRAYALGNANAQFATQVQSNWGLFTRFVARPGAMLPFGTGCPGEGFVTPVGTALSLASPGIVWNHQLSQASSQRLAMWIIGDSRTQWGSFALPLDLSGSVGGVFLGAAGCVLLTNPVATMFATTVGGGAGAGIANVAVQLPPITNYIGLSVYTQWFVADPLAGNGILSASAGLWTRVAPVGG
jgi:hypothetical protein